MKTAVASVLAGGLFGFGLAISGVAQPQRVLGFLDWTGAFDPTLLFVMAAAVGVHFVGRWLALRRSAPILGERWPSFPFTGVDARLLLGSALFGAGWGLTGFCPAPGIISATSGTREGLIFAVAMVAGMAIFHMTESLLARRPTDETGAEPGSAA